MNKDSINQIIARLDRLEKAVFGSGSKAKAGEKKLKGSPPEGLPKHILALRNQGFFGEPKTAGEVHGKLQPKYRCEPDRVAMALLRLQRRKKLRKSSKVVGQKKQVAYVW
jgi:hypothetical protein